MMTSNSFRPTPAEPTLHPLAVDDILALSGLPPRDLAARIGVSVRELHAALVQGASGLVAEAICRFEESLPREWSAQAVQDLERRGR
jgi:hypothetical protein